MKTSNNVETSKRVEKSKRIQKSKLAKPTRLVIENPAATKLTVALLVNGRAIQLRPGERYGVSGQQHAVAFDRGGKLGHTKKRLSPGFYQFQVSRNTGWQLRSSTGTPQ